MHATYIINPESAALPVGHDVDLHAVVRALEQLTRGDRVQRPRSLQLQPLDQGPGLGYMYIRIYYRGITSGRTNVS